MDLLKTIIESKRRRVEQAKRSAPIARVREAAEAVRSQARSHRLREAMNSENLNIIAEFKRRSPSKGDINSTVEPAHMALIYESAGAAAMSVLTEEDFFSGSLDDLRAAREVSSLPILRKDFIFDEYQAYESAAAGADALLLIVAALDAATLHELRALTEETLGMDALVEVHTKDELDQARNSGATLIGVNNRDLKTFTVSTEISVQLARLAPPEAVLISESGLTLKEIRNLREVGYKGFLVGEALMAAPDPASALRSFMASGEQLTEPIRIKICGITNIQDARDAVGAGADMLGFNFYHGSRRYISPEDARAIVDVIRSEVANKEITMVGVFVDEATPEELCRIAETSGVNAVQLHGDESPDFCRKVKNITPELKVIKVFRVGAELGISDLAHTSADAVMLDTFDSRLRGGTGQSFDWTIAKQAREIVPRLYLAGGLSPENVAQAIAEVNPFAVDACSSLELSPGRKDEQRMKEFVRAARGR